MQFLIRKTPHLFITSKWDSRAFHWFKLGTDYFCLNNGHCETELDRKRGHLEPSEAGTVRVTN